MSDETKHTVQLLEEGRTRIAVAGGWWGGPGRLRKGRYCAITALPWRENDVDDALDALDAASGLLGYEIPGEAAARYNDTHELPDVLALYDRAIAAVAV